MYYLIYFCESFLAPLYYAGEIEEPARLLGKAVRLDMELCNHAGIKKMLNDRLEFNGSIHDACRHDHAAEKHV